MKFDLKGSIVALITPFHEDGSVNFEKLHELLEWHVANHTDGILVLGTTGESSTMTHEEDDAVVEFTLQTINKRIPVIVGSGSNCTQTAVEKSLKYECLTGHFPILQQSQCQWNDSAFSGRSRCRSYTNHHV